MRKDAGVAFPADSSGRRSTTRIGRTIVASAVRQVDSDLANRLQQERNWRKNYGHYFVGMTEASVQSAEAALTIAQNGLDAVWQSFEFVRDGETHTIKEALDKFNAPYFHTAVVEGQGSPEPLQVPYKGKVLSGNALDAQIDDWLDRSIMEPSHADAIRRISAKPDWVYNGNAHVWVMMGAGSEVGPYETLLSLGATIVAIDLKRPDIWERLIRKARQSAGTLIFPVHVEPDSDMTDEELAAFAGANLVEQAPEIATWLKSLDRPMTIGAYAYLDSGDFVRVALAMDMVMQSVSAARDNVSLAYLLTPTDVMAVPAEVADFVDKRREQGGIGRTIAHLISATRWFRPNIISRVTSRSGRQYGIVDSLIGQQGPNYTLAKRMQRWRAVIAREQGTLVSCNVAPATTTRSVTKNQLFMKVYKGAESFGIEIFAPETTNVIMTAQLVDDVYHPTSAANPATKLANPEELFMEGANHGGLWRMPNQLGSMIEPSLFMGYARSLSGATS